MSNNYLDKRRRFTQPIKPKTTPSSECKTKQTIKKQNTKQALAIDEQSGKEAIAYVLEDISNEKLVEDCPRIHLGH